MYACSSLQNLGKQRHIMLLTRSSDLFVHALGCTLCSGWWTCTCVHDVAGAMCGVKKIVVV